MCTFGIPKILVKEGGGMVSAHSEGDLAPKKVPWRPCAKIMSFNETFFCTMEVVGYSLQ